MNGLEKQEFIIRFEGLSPADAGAQALMLKEALLDSFPDVSAKIERSGGETMDLGATLILLLGTPAVIAVAKGISAYLARERKGTLIIESDGRIVFEGSSSDAAKIAQALQPSLPPAVGRT